jgi:hypothetical protein
MKGLSAPRRGGTAVDVETVETILERRLRVKTKDSQFTEHGGGPVFQLYGHRRLLSHRGRYGADASSACAERAGWRGLRISSGGQHFIATEVVRGSRHHNKAYWHLFYQQAFNLRVFTQLDIRKA